MNGEYLILHKAPKVDRILSDKETEMLNNLAKLLFVATSLAPILCVFAVCDIDKGNGYYVAGFLFWFAAVLVSSCWFFLRRASQHVAKEPIKIRSLSSTDKETLAYLIAYLLPVISGGTMDIRENMLASIMVLTVLVMCVFHTNAFHFNPLLGLFGYHFCEITTTSGNTAMLITKRTHRCQEQILNVRELWDLVYLDAGDNEYEEVLRIPCNENGRFDS